MATKKKVKIGFGERKETKRCPRCRSYDTYRYFRGELNPKTWGSISGIMKCRRCKHIWPVRGKRT